MKHALLFLSGAKKHLITLTLLSVYFQVAYTQTIRIRPSTDSSKKSQDKWMQGVDLYDLLLMSRHVCGVEQLDSPLKLLAADVNSTNEVTMFDVVVLRNVLLGRADTFADRKPWEYIDADYVFKNPVQPFEEASRCFIPEKAITDSERNVIAVKIGDVNNSHTSDDIPGMPRIGAQPIGIGKPSHRVGEFVTIPVSYEGTEALAAIQLGLQFDADHWELLEPSTADLPDFEPGCFNLREAGEGRIKFLWFTPWPKEQLQQGRTLFYLTFRRKSADADAPLNLQTDERVLENAGFMDSGLVYEFKSTESVEERAPGTAPILNWSATCAPNPVTDRVTLSLENPVQQAMSVWVFNALGVRTYYMEITAPAGTKQVTIPEVAGWPAGIYTWKVKSGREKRQGQFVRR